MEIQPAEIIDRMSIVKIKIERIKNPILKKEYDALKDALNEFKSKGVEIREEWLDELYEINKEEWDLLDKMNQKRKGAKDLAKIGALYLETELVNKRRAEAKNKIIELTGKG